MSERNDAEKRPVRQGRPRRRGFAHSLHADASDVTPFVLHCAQRCLRKNFSRSLRVQKGMVAHAHVRRFQTSRTAFMVILYRFDSTEVKLSRAEREALAK